MIKCKLCGLEKETAREMHGHLIRCHDEEYRASGFDTEGMTVGYKRKNQEERNKDKRDKRKGGKVMAEKKDSKPENLRLLNKSNDSELQAYNEGFRYLDPDEMIAYTTAEVKEEGWI